jgi:hypothetical protein
MSDERGVGVIRMLLLWGVLAFLAREAILAGWIDRLIM